MVIQHNLQAQNASGALKSVQSMQDKSTKKLSSGYKINSAADDAAGLSISEKMRQQIRGLDKASKNAQDGVSLIQVAEGTLNEVHSILQRMNELATQAANDTNTDSDRAHIKDELDQLAVEIDRCASTTQFNTMNLLDGSFRHKNLQVGAVSEQNLVLDLKAMDAHGLGLTLSFDGTANLQILDTALERVPSIEYIELGDETWTAYPGVTSADAVTGKKAHYESSKNLYVSSYEMAGRSMKLIQNAVGVVSEMRSYLGAAQNRLEHTIANLDTSKENTSASESRIRDTDMAEEMVQYSKNNILSQVGQSMLAQANQSTQGVLSILQ